MGKHAQSIDSAILERIRGHGPGWVFTPSHFTDLGSRTAVASALKRHKQAGTIRQIARGLYEVPRHDPQLGVLSPSIDAVVEALQGRDAIHVQTSGGYAANLLGLSDQVPMKIVLLTDGPARRIELGKQVIQLKRTTPRTMATARVDHLTEHGVMEATLLYESPFTDITAQGPDGLFSSPQMDELITGRPHMDAGARGSMRQPCHRPIATELPSSFRSASSPPRPPCPTRPSGTLPGREAPPWPALRKEV